MIYELAERKAGKLIFNLQTGCGYFVQCTPQIALTQYQQIQSRIAALSKIAKPLRQKLIEFGIYDNKKARRQPGPVEAITQPTLFDCSTER